MLNNKAPDFCLPNQDNEEVCLNDLEGSWIVLYFYPKDNTPGCTNEAKDFSKELKNFQKLNAKIIGISPDSTKSHKNFIEKHNLKIDLLSDKDKEVLKKYNVWDDKVIRSTFILDPNLNIRRIWKKVKVKDHAKEVKQELKDLKSV